MRLCAFSVLAMALAITGAAAGACAAAPAFPDGTVTDFTAQWVSASAAMGINSRLGQPACRADEKDPALHFCFYDIAGVSLSLSGLDPVHGRGLQHLVVFSMDAKAGKVLEDVVRIAALVVAGRSHPPGADFAAALHDRLSGQLETLSTGDRAGSIAGPGFRLMVVQSQAGFLSVTIDPPGP